MPNAAQMSPVADVRRTLSRMEPSAKPASESIPVRGSRVESTSMPPGSRSAFAIASWTTRGSESSTTAIHMPSRSSRTCTASAERWSPAFWPRSDLLKVVTEDFPCRGVAVAAGRAVLRQARPRRMRERGAALEADLELAASVAGITQVGIAYGLQGAAGILVMRLVATKLAGRPADEFERQGAMREPAYGGIVGASLVTMTVLPLLAAGAYEVTDITVGRGLLTGLPLGLGSPFGEEVVMRGILLRVLIGRLATTAA